MDFDTLVSSYGINKESIIQEQLVFVKTNNNTAQIYLFEKRKLFLKIDEAYIGKNGASQIKIEGDLKTPLGLFDLGIAFGTEDLNIDYSYRKITENSYWVDDVKSSNYNKWVEYTSETDKDWNSAEHLIEYPVQYKYGLVIEYNTINQYDERKKIGNGLGSAIFFHVFKRNYTAGCVAVSEENMLKILNWIKNAQILIV